MGEIKRGTASNILRFTLKSSVTGQGLTGLSSASSGLIISTICNNEATATAYTVAASNVETITTLGTYSAPTASKCRFKEVSATNHPGLYEFQFADARFNVASSKALVISVSGATNLLGADYEVELVDNTAKDVYDRIGAAGAGLTVLASASNLAAVAAYVDTEIGAIIAHLLAMKGATFSEATDSLEALRDRGDVAWITGGSGGATAGEVWAYAQRSLTDKAGFSLAADQAVNATKINGSASAAAQLALSAATILNGAAATGTLSTTEMTTNLTFTVADQMNGRVLIFAPDTTTVALRNQATNITATTVLNGKLGFTALTTAPANGDTFVIV